MAVVYGPTERAATRTWMRGRCASRSAAMRIARSGVGDTPRRLRDRVIQRGLAVRGHARERRFDRARVAGERLQRLQVHVEAEDGRFVVV